MSNPEGRPPLCVKALNPAGRGQGSEGQSSRTRKIRTEHLSGIVITERTDVRIEINRENILTKRPNRPKQSRLWKGLTLLTKKTGRCS